MSKGQEEIKTLEKLRKETKNIRMNNRLLVICLHLRGYSNKHIGTIVSIEEHTVGKYIKEYLLDGVNGLVSKKQSGRPTFFSKEQEASLYTTISEKTPDEVGFAPFKNWTANLACLWVRQEFEIKFSVGGMTDLFHRINLSNTRSTYVLAKANLDKQAEFIEEFEKVKKNFIMVK